MTAVAISGADIFRNEGCKAVLNALARAVGGELTSRDLEKAAGFNNAVTFKHARDRLNAHNILTVRKDAQRRMYSVNRDAIKGLLERAQAELATLAAAFIGESEPQTTESSAPTRSTRIQTAGAGKRRGRNASKSAAE